MEAACREEGQAPIRPERDRQSREDRTVKEDVEAEVDHIVEHYADADRERATVYAETILTNEKVFKFLEKC